jgi:hypothetical protein
LNGRYSLAVCQSIDSDPIDVHERVGHYVKRIDIAVDAGGAAATDAKISSHGSTRNAWASRPRMVTLLELRRLLIEAADQGPLIEQLASQLDLSGNSFGSVTNIVASLHCTPCNPVTTFVAGNSLFVNWEGAGGQVGDTQRLSSTRPISLLLWCYSARRSLGGC